MFGFDSIQAIATLIFVALLGAIFFSVFVDFVITFPMRDFKKKLKATWSEKKTLPDIGTLPEDVQELALGFVDAIEDTKNTMKVMGEMHKLDDVKYEFISIASHQLRTPMGEISWAVDALGEMDTVTKDSDVTELVGKIKSSITRVIEVTNEFLTIAELSMNQTMGEVVSVDVFGLIDSITGHLKLLASQKKMTISIQKDPQLISTVAGDPRLLSFVFETLITNAISYGNADTSINIHLSNGPATVVVSVENTGITVKAEEMQTMFEKFFRGQEARSISPNGSGLALYLSRRILSRYAGKISCENANEHQVIFTVTLPFETSSELKEFVVHY